MMAVFLSLVSLPNVVLRAYVSNATDRAVGAPCSLGISRKEQTIILLESRASDPEMVSIETRPSFLSQTMRPRRVAERKEKCEYPGLPSSIEWRPSVEDWKTRIMCALVMRRLWWRTRAVRAHSL
ncbi:hypothetical protein DFP72DRAFT_201733 [Ephemerocybe angulata]|uniref:Secreted protein n=1 Tax=Ephemerocybe angulata TaxID=980116 RepID=A0A8H6MDI4_9AGAR|nr:hypothetical protein DFP72DRAFT_201733 [Tulosesus angulatus]